MKITRLFTTAGQDPLTSVEFVKRTSEIKNPDGSIVFKMEDVSVPKRWSQVATDVIAQNILEKRVFPNY
jgi:ribonucleoside-diphosphate reductase alpha chain